MTKPQDSFLRLTKFSETLKELYTNRIILSFKKLAFITQKNYKGYPDDPFCVTMEKLPIIIIEELTEGTDLKEPVSIESESYLVEKNPGLIL